MSLRLPLKVFVSSKEDELKEERRAARFVIESLGLKSLGSEERPPSGNSMEETNTEEVMNSDLYIGIFWEAYSPATIREYNTAKANKIPVLLFWKDVLGVRAPELSDFHNKVKNPAEGVVVGKFENLDEFQRKLVHALQWNITDRMRKSRKLLQHNIPDVEISAKTAVPHVDKIPGAIALGFGRILSFQIPREIKKGKEMEVSIKIRANGRYIFADLLIVDPDKQNYWYPDLRSWNSTLNQGTKELNDEEYSSSWSFAIPSTCVDGKYIAFMGIYEDTLYLSTWNRRLIAYDQREFVIGQ